MQSARWARRWGSTRPALRTVVVHGWLVALASFAAVAHAQSDTPVVAAPPVAMPAPLPAGAPDADYTSAGYAGSTQMLTEPTPPPGVPTAPAWDLEHRAYNTWEGSTGGIYVVDPGMGEPGAIRMQLALDMFSGGSFLYDGDHVEQNRQFLSVSWTALRTFEVFGSLKNSATVANSPRQNTLHSFGDATLGIKVGGPVADLLRVGATARLVLVNSIGQENSLIDSTSVGLGVNAALDLQKLQDPLPFIGRVNVDYFFDNSGRILDRTESIRYHNLDNALDPEDETRHLVTRVERFGLGINRVDMLTLSAGLEFPIQLTERMFLHPLADFRFGIPLNRQGFDCAFRSSDDDRATTKPGSDDGCLDDGGAGAWPVTLAVGARFVPPIRGVSVFLGADIAFNGTDTFVREVAPTAPFRIMLALSYDYDARPEAAGVAMFAPATGALAGRLLGHVTDEATGQPLQGVVVRFVGGGHQSLTTDASGRFITEPLPPGEVALELAYSDYEPRRCVGTVPATGDAEIACSLSQSPASGSLKLTVRDQYGVPVAGARISLAGPSVDSGATDAAGELLAIALIPGDYKVRVESDQHLVRVVRVGIGGRQQSQLEVTVLRKPLVSSVQRNGSTISTPKLRFENGSTALGPEATQSVAELADLLLRDTSIRRIRVQADGGDPLAQNRAIVIKQQLVEMGLPESRVDVVSESGSAVTITVVE
jgi:outer membrane protein OmpA-like peptidoglycan-associated protein